MFAAGASDQPPNSCQDGPGRGPVGWDRPFMAFFVSDAKRNFLPDSVAVGEFEGDDGVRVWRHAAWENGTAW